MRCMQLFQEGARYMIKSLQQSKQRTYPATHVYQSKGHSNTAEELAYGILLKASPRQTHGDSVAPCWSQTCKCATDRLALIPNNCISVSTCRQTEVSQPHTAGNSCFRKARDRISTGAGFLAQRAERGLFTGYNSLNIQLACTDTFVMLRRRRAMTGTCRTRGAIRQPAR